MSLYKQWTELAEKERAAADSDSFWAAYFEKEQSIYEKILKSKEPIAGKFSELAEQLVIEPVHFAGFIYGINTSLKAGEYELDDISEDSDISLAVDLPLLYRNMLEAKADWLYELPQWESLLSDEERRNITKDYKTSKIFVAQPTVGRNDPCPCGSGKKYKACCGKQQ